MLSGLDERPADAADTSDRPAAVPPRAAGRLTEHRVLLAVALVAYFAVFGSILVWTGGLPYIIDNNESFSTLWHAQNMAQHDIRLTYGLTDEVFSPHPAAHPFVHSHQGNVPRLYAFVLYVLGARSIEAQIVLTTLTIGTLTYFFLFRFFSVTAGPRFAFVAALVFLTDYLFFTQWQVVTYRVWHGFFLFASLLCAHGAARSPHRRRWLVLTGLTYLGLFYYELVFVAFVSLFSAFYMALLAWRTPKRVVQFGLVQVAGGATALAILFLQLALYLGWDGLREDIYLTYVARNFATETADLSRLSPWSVHDVLSMIGGITSIDPALRERLDRFYDRHNLIFWWNLADSRPLRQPTFFVASLFIWVFQIYTPLFVLLVMTILGGWVLGADAPRLWRSRVSATGGDLWAARGRASRSWFQVRGSLAIERQRRQPPADHLNGAETEQRASSAAAPIALLFVAAAVFLLATTLIRDDAYKGLPLSRLSFLGQIGIVRMVSLLAGCLIGTFLAARWLAGSWAAVAAFPARRLVLVGAGLVGLALFIRTQPGLYDQEYAPVWHGLISGRVPSWMGRAAVLLAAALVVAMVVRGRRALLGAEQALALERVGPYLLCGVAAYGIVYYLAAGYVLTGYLVRFGPLVVFLIDVLIAVAVSIVAAAVLQTLAPLAGLVARRPAAAARPATSSDRAPSAALQGAGQRGRLVAGGCAAALLVFMTGYWVHTQRAYVSAFPPDRFTFLRMFAQTPYRGASFAVSTYAAPLAHFTQQWAYFDPLISNGQVQLIDGQIRLMQDTDTYLWLADRRTNPRYSTPEYYACITTPSLRGLLQRETGQEPRTGRCSIIAMVQRAQSPDQELMRFTLVARDESPSDAWAVVRLNWEKLPYLKPIPDRGPPTTVIAELASDRTDPAVNVTYQYVDPYDHPERGTVIRLYEPLADGTRRLLRQATGMRRLELPPAFQGKLVVSVAPSDGTRAGPEYFSQPLEVSP